MILVATALRAASYILIGSESTPPCLNAMYRGTDGAYADQWPAGGNRKATTTEVKEAETTVGALAESSSGERAVDSKHLWQERAEREREQAEQELFCLTIIHSSHRTTLAHQDLNWIPRSPPMDGHVPPPTLSSMPPRKGIVKSGNAGNSSKNNQPPPAEDANPEKSLFPPGSKWPLSLLHERYVLSKSADLPGLGCFPILVLCPLPWTRK